MRSILLRQRQPREILCCVQGGRSAQTAGGIREKKEGEHQKIVLRQQTTNIKPNLKGGSQLNKELEKLRAEQEKDLKMLEQLQRQQQRLQNRITYLEKGKRQKRAHRLITKGAAIESLVPATKEMGETEFFSMMEKILSLPSVIPLLPQKEDDE